MAPRGTSIRLVDPEPQQPALGPTDVDLEQPQVVTIDDNGVARTENPDGSVTFDTSPQKASKPDNGNFYRNLADDIGPDELGRIASELITGIDADIDSRKEWMETRRRGIQLLALKIEEPRGDLGTAAPLDGMSSVRHPLLLEATIKFQATARGELLPATGPVKVRNDLPSRPDVPLAQPGQAAMGHNGGPPLAPEGESLDELGNALEKDMNHYLTVTATEYVPDTDRILFYIGFGGDGFKKVYNCPLRRRPVSESVDAEDLIVSNAATDLRNCGRVTHRIKMRPSILRRMQIIGEYRDVKLGSPSPTQQTAPEQEKAIIAGQRPPMRPQDSDYEIYECYCEWDLDDFAPKQFKGKALPLPYVVTLEKESRQVLAVRRNWDPDDEQCLAKRFFVQFPFIRGLGFYGLGLIHILGNVTLTLTAAWREMLDNGMFANFPGFLFAKSAGRQNTNQFRIPPGGGAPFDVPAGMDDIRKAIMPAPYKETGPAHQAFVAHVEEVGQRLGQTADINVGEGKQEVPVGTTMALIEQATKIMDSVHKRLHAAQAEEFGLLKERFKEDPEAFWRHNKRPARKWTEDQFKQALEQRELVPVADPNNPTSLHRIAKSVALLTLAQSYQQFFNIGNVLKRILRVVGIDAEGLLNAQPAPPPPDPRFAAIQAKAQAEAATAQIQQFQAYLKMQQMQLDASGKAQDRASRERIEYMQMMLERMRVEQEAIIHAHDVRNSAAETQAGIQADQLQTANKLAMDRAQHSQELSKDSEKHAHQMAVERERDNRQLEAERERHGQQMRHTEEKHAADLEHKRAMARVKPKGNGNGSSSS